MKGLLVHIGADTTTLSVVAPIFPDDTFEYIPIKEIYGLGIKTYRDIPARNTKYGRTLADFLPSDLARLPVHLDPNFDNFTYGEPFKEQPKFWTLMKLAEGDLIFFIASLAPYNPEIYEKRDALLRSYQVGRRDKYVVGFFQVKGIAEVYVMKSKSRLALAMLNIYVLLEEGASPLDLKSLKYEIRRLEEYGYIMERNGRYEFTEEGLRIIDGLLEDLSGRTESEQYELLEKGSFEVRQLIGEVAEEDVKGNQHYKRLRDLDWDHFIVIKGKPESSALLKRAVKLTEGFEGYWFKLNELGREVLQRKYDSLRGMRWINKKAATKLVQEISRCNKEMVEELQRNLLK